jgi:uracil-DNA glycosylase family 4
MAIRTDLEEYLEVLNYDSARFIQSAQNSPQQETGSIAAPLPENSFLHPEENSMPKKPAHLEYFSSEHEDLNWTSLKDRTLACQSCKLAPTRTQVVFGSGNAKAQLMFVGEGPGAEEDIQGLPFVGRSGQLLTKMIEAMGLKRSDVFIANVVKCRPPMNRNPEPDEIAKCSPYLRRQVELIGPKIIVALGTFAAQIVLSSETPIGQLRGRFHLNPALKDREGNPVKIMPTYHPAFCLRNPHMKKPVWEDLQVVIRELGLKGASAGIGLAPSPSPSL